MRIREEQREDRQAVGELIRAAFGEEGPAVAAIWAELSNSVDLLAGRVAQHDDGDLVGHVGLSRAWVDARPALVEVALLSPLSVRPDRQGQGLGVRLIEAAVQAVEELGLPFVVLEGDPGYYSRHGFRPAAEFGIEPVSVRVPGPAVQVLPVSPEVWMTGRLVYPDLWWRRGMVGFREPQLTDLESRLTDRL